MKFDEAVNEHDGHEDPNQDPTSHHPDRAMRLPLHENQSDKPDKLSGRGWLDLDILHCRNTTRTSLSIRLGGRRHSSSRQ